MAAACASACARDEPGSRDRLSSDAGKSAEHHPPFRPDAPKPTYSASMTTIWASVA